MHISSEARAPEAVEVSCADFEHQLVHRMVICSNEPERTLGRLLDGVRSTDAFLQSATLRRFHHASEVEVAIRRVSIESARALGATVELWDSVQSVRLEHVFLRSGAD